MPHKPSWSMIEQRNWRSMSSQMQALGNHGLPASVSSAFEVTVAGIILDSRTGLRRNPSERPLRGEQLAWFCPEERCAFHPDMAICCRLIYNTDATLHS